MKPEAITETVTVRTAALKAALLTAGTKDVRYYLNGVYFRKTPQGTRMESTNGHVILFAWNQVEGDALDGLILARDDLAEAVKATAKGPRACRDTVQLEITHGGGVPSTVRAILTGCVRTVEVIDGRFPNSDPMLEGELSPVAGVGVSGDYLGVLGDVVRALSYDKWNGAKLGGQTRTGALWWSIQCGVGRAGFMVMPLKMDAPSCWPGAAPAAVKVAA